MSENVIPMDQAKKKAAKEKPKEDKDKQKQSSAEYFRIMATHINGGETNLFNGELSPFPNKYWLVSSEDEDRSLLIESDNQIVKFCKPIKFKSDIGRFIEDKLPHHEFYPSMGPRAISEAFNMWELMSDTIKMPSAFKFKSESGLCFHRMPFDPIYDDGSGCPIFSEIVSRISTNRDSFLAFIGSIFIPDSDRQQYAWVWGEGLNGKGVIIRFLEKCLGPGYINRDTPKSNDMFWNAPLKGKRLCMFSDCRDTSFPTTPIFKMLSGGDSVPIREMKKTEYLAKIECKFMFASNEYPEISSQRSDQRRAILCELNDSNVPMRPGYEDDLWEEAPMIIGWCINEYKRLCPNNEHIPVDPEVNKDIAAVYDEEIASVFNQYFVVEKNKGFVSSNEYDRVFRKEFGSASDAKKRKFCKWVKSYDGVEFGKNEKGRRGILGVNLRANEGIISDRIEII